MLEAVEGARGALPLLAFAVSRLWDKRDRQKRSLTRAAYEEIGGVAGALAQHAEQTLERIGSDKQGLVREMFRNLATAEGTRASCELEELLSVFGERRVSAEEVLGQLIDARLLTSYEVEDAHSGRVSEEARAENLVPSSRTTHRIEVIHESLLKAWPRLVMWQAQDEEGAVLRDQLRQAAHIWEEKGRSDDVLWTGGAFREFELWRERYPGQLTALEEEYTQAMVAHHRRRRNLRHGALAVVFVVLAVVAAAIAVSRQNEAEARRQAEAAELLALGRLELEDRPTAGLAYALASLERADTLGARRFAVETLSRGAAAFVLDSSVVSVSFSRDGQWLATSGFGSGTRLWSRGGAPPVPLGEWAGLASAGFDPEGPFLKVSGVPRPADGVAPSDDDVELRVYSVPDPKPILVLPGKGLRAALSGSHLLTFQDDEHGTTVRAQQVGESEARRVGRWAPLNATSWWVDVSGDGQWLAYARDREVFLHPVEGEGVSERRVGEHSGKVLLTAFAPGDERLVSTDDSGEVRIWSVDEGTSRLVRAVSGPEGVVMLPFAGLDRQGSTLAAGENGGHVTPDVAFVWDLDGPPDAEPLALRNGDVQVMTVLEVSPDGRWLATANGGRAILWSLGGRRGRVLRRQTFQGFVAFTPDGRWLASTGFPCGVEGCDYSSGVALYPLSPAVAPGRRVILEGGGSIAFDADGSTLLAQTGENGNDVLVVPLDGGAPRTLPRLSSAPNRQGRALSRDGHLAAAGTSFDTDGKGNLIEVWDLQSGEGRTLDPRSEGEECGDDPTNFSTVHTLEFTSDGRLLTAGLSGLRLWNLADDTNVLLRPCAEGVTKSILAGSLEDRFLLAEVDETARVSTLSFHDLRAGVSRELTSHGNQVLSVALDPKGEFAVTGSFDGLIRVGPVTGEEPHLLFGHVNDVQSVAVSPDGRWIASRGADNTVRLWPMPQGRPFHALPHEELLERIRSYTNLRAVADEGSVTGYGVEAGPFPGWAVVPEW
jgi:WD40 repeat protein